MTKEEFLQKVDELIPDLNEYIRDKAKQVTNSGAIEFSDFENDYFLAKIFMSAMGMEIEYQYRPLTKQGLEIRKNLPYFI